MYVLPTCMFLSNPRYNRENIKGFNFWLDFLPEHSCLFWNQIKLWCWCQLFHMWLSFKISYTAALQLQTCNPVWIQAWVTIYTVLYILPIFMWVSWFLPTTQKHVSGHYDYNKLPLGVNKCVTMCAVDSGSTTTLTEKKQFLKNERMPHTSIIQILNMV